MNCLHEMSFCNPDSKKTPSWSSLLHNIDSHLEIKLINDNALQESKWSIWRGSAFEFDFKKRRVRRIARGCFCCTRTVNAEWTHRGKFAFKFKVDRESRVPVWCRCQKRDSRKNRFGKVGIDQFFTSKTTSAILWRLTSLQKKIEPCQGAGDLYKLSEGKFDYITTFW